MSPDQIFPGQLMKSVGDECRIQSAGHEVIEWAVIVDKEGIWYKTEFMPNCDL